MNNLFKPRKLNLKSVTSLFPDSMITKVKNLDFDFIIRVRGTEPVVIGRSSSQKELFVLDTAQDGDDFR